MKNPGHCGRHVTATREKRPLPDLRIDFAVIAALITTLLQRQPLMSADPFTTPEPLGDAAQFPTSFDTFLERNQKLLGLLAVLAVIGAIGWIVFRGIEQGKEHSGGAALTQADNLEAYENVVKDYSGSTAAGSAKVLLADKQWADGQQDAAIETLRNFIASEPNHAALPAARASLGSKLASQGKTDEAVREFETLTTTPAARYIAPYALISLGDLAASSGDTEKAESHYQRVRTEFAQSGFIDTANRRIASLKAKLPVEIDPPAEPAPAEAPVTPPLLAPSQPGLDSQSIQEPEAEIPAQP